MKSGKNAVQGLGRSSNQSDRVGGSHRPAEVGHWLAEQAELAVFKKRQVAD
jgi:hypothetical protein